MIGGCRSGAAAVVGVLLVESSANWLVGGWCLSVLLVPVLCGWVGVWNLGWWLLVGCLAHCWALRNQAPSPVLSVLPVLSVVFGGGRGWLSLGV